MLTNESVLKIFANYLIEDDSLDLLETKHGYALMLWDTTAQDWSDIICCRTPEELFNRLLEFATSYYEYLILQKQHRDYLNSTEKIQIEAIRQKYLKAKIKLT